MSALLKELCIYRTCRKSDHSTMVIRTVCSCVDLMRGEEDLLCGLVWKVFFLFLVLLRRQNLISEQAIDLTQHSESSDYFLKKVQV